LHCPSCFDLQLLLTPLVSSTFSFNSISVISCRSVLLFGETGVLGEDYRPVAIHWNKCIMESCIEYILPWAVFKLIGLVVIGTACTCSRKSNYQSITTTMANWSQLTDIWHEMLTKQGCLYGTHNLWYTDLSVDFWLSQRNKKVKAYIVLYRKWLPVIGKCKYISSLTDIDFCRYKSYIIRHY
jgi:hypothetical protein